MGSDYFTTDFGVAGAGSDPFMTDFDAAGASVSPEGRDFLVEIAIGFFLENKENSLSTWITSSIIANLRKLMAKA